MYRCTSCFNNICLQFFLGLCTFEADLCDFDQDTTDQFDWTRDRNGTYSQGTGPRFDHTTRSQYGELAKTKFLILKKFCNSILVVFQYTCRFLK